MKTLENMAFLQSLQAVGRSLWVKPQARMTKANKIKGFEHVSYGTALKTVQTLLLILEIPIEAGIRYDNPARFIKTMKVRLKPLQLPSRSQFLEIVKSVRGVNKRFSNHAADLIELLAYGGFRKSEVQNIRWSDCDFDRGQILVRGDEGTSTKNWTVRTVPMIPDMCQLLERLKAQGPKEPTDAAVVLSFKKPNHEQHMGKMAELILKNEAPGILNWLLEGRAKPAKDKLQLTQTPEQLTRTSLLLLGSDSPAAFVRSCLVKKKDAELGVVDLYAYYQEWCRENHVKPFASKAFTSTAKEEIEIGLGLKYRHDLEGGNGKAKRGWRGLALVEADAKNASMKSGEQVVAG